MLGFQAVQAEWLADSIRDNVLRGIVGAAEAGRPHGKVIGDGMWDGLVDEDTFWAAVRLLKDPSRTTTRPGRAVHLLSYVDPLCGVRRSRIAPSAT